MPRRWGRRVTAGAEEQRARDAGVPPEVTGTPTYSDPAESAPVSRGEAMSCPAVVGALHVIAGRGSVLPLRRYTGVGDPIDPGTFLHHPEPDVNRPRQWTLLRTFADMCLGEFAYWRVMLRDYRGYPLAAVHVEPQAVSARTHHVPGIGTVIDGWNVAGVDVPLGDLIRFTGPTPGGWCVAGARVIRTALALERAAKAYAEEPVPSVILKNDSGVDLPPDKVDGLLGAWKKGRKNGATAYLNSAVSATPVGFNARDLQLVEGRQQLVLEMARLTGVPHGLLGAAPSGSSITYRNLEGEAFQAFDAMHPYLAAVEQRLSQEDITPRGQTVRFDTTAMLRPDTATQVDLIARLQPLGIITDPEARGMLGLPATQPIAGPQGADVAIGPDPAATPTPGSGAPS